MSSGSFEETAEPKQTLVSIALLYSLSVLGHLAMQLTIWNTILIPSALNCQLVHADSVFVPSELGQGPARPG